MDDLGWEILKALPEPVIFVDAEHAVQFINPAAVKLFEIRDVDDVIGTAFKLFPGGTGLMTHEERIEAVKRSNELATQPAPTPKLGDEQIWIGGSENKLFHFHAIPVHDKAKDSISNVIRIDDITKERLASEYLHGLLSDMILPTEMIRGYSEVLLLTENAQNLNDEQRDWIEKIKHNCAKLLSLRESVYDRIST
ncbi:MAG: PAS domain-containing protein [Anaerolineae bacterium]|nr:PAS domain-containing protein [Anaerolineae bacterium]